MNRLLQVCFIAAMVFGLAACEKEKNNTSGGGGSSTTTPSSLVGTDWSFYDGEATIVVSFPTASDVDVNVHTPHGDEFYYGSYTYSEGSGTMNLTINNQEYEIRFTVTGNTMTAYNTPSGDVTLTRVNNQQPDPNPQPGPGGDYPLNGTSWTYENNDGENYEMYSVSFGTTTCILVMSTTVEGSAQQTGSYTYEGTINSGSGTITLENGNSAVFEVNGNEALVNVWGASRMFTRVR